ncbi:MAG: 50S ribosomal protein L18 [Patescibacteria group bacterium]
MKNTKIRARRTRAKLGKNRPRLSVFVSNTHIYAQIIDDKTGKTLVSASDKDTGISGKSVDVAQKVGEILGQYAKAAKLKEVVFDRGSKKYHGKIKALAEGARKELSF